MKLILLSLLFFISHLAHSENVVRNTVSYEKEGRCVSFSAGDGSVLQLRMCSPSVVRIWYSPDGTLERRNSSFAVVEEDLADVGEVVVNEQAACYEIFTDRLRIRVNKAPFGLQIFDKWQKLIFSDHPGRGRVSDGTRKIEYKSLRRDEHFFGLGEKTGKLDRRGGNYRMWNSDKPCYGVSEDPLYKSIPFFMSSYKYGIFLDNTYKTEFKFGTENEEFYSFEVPDGEMIYYFISGKDYKDIMTQYISLTGRPIMPPRWALGFAQCRGKLTNEDLTYEIARGYRERGIPCDIIYQDIGWTQELQNFEWRRPNYRNPEKMLADLDSMGFKVILSQDPVISQKNVSQWKEADSLGFFVKDASTGRTYDMPWPWGGNCGVVDFTIPEVADWWGEYQQKPLDDGAAGFWTDMGEPAWSNEESTERLVMKHHLGMHDEIHNVYGLTWDKVVAEQFAKRNPDRRIFQMTRAAYAGLQRYTFGWTGDSGCADNVLKGWAQMENQISVLLSAGLGAIPFTTTDITGYCGDIEDYPAMAELFTRWIQLGAFNPLSRIHHEGDNAVEPWLFGAEAERNARAAIELKYSLLPYIYTYSRAAYDAGLPIMRPMVMEFPEDGETYGLDTQFMFGEEILVAPVVKKGARIRTLYLPDGEWIDFNDRGSCFAGGQWITVDAPLNVIPMFVRKGSIIPRMPVMNHTREHKVYPVTFEVFPAAEGGKASFSLYEDQGEDLGYQRGEYRLTPVSCSTGADHCEIVIGERQGKGYETVGSREFIFDIYAGRTPKSVLLDGAKARKGKVWTTDKKNGMCSLHLPDDGMPHTIRLSF